LPQILDIKEVMKRIIPLLLFLLFISATGIAQNDTIKLKEVIITSSRIDLPFSENSRTISIISSKNIQRSAATNIADLLQQVAGIDVRRRGIDGMQSDLYIRGGHFNQTLVLIDGIKTEDPQTGHHTMNMMIPLENIERIEIIKGSAARVFGQNAFNGAINIVTKKVIENNTKVSLTGGSFDRKSINVTTSVQLKGASHQIHYSNNSSDGYRDNTDFKNQNYFIKSSINTKNEPIIILASFGERKFGANNFYTNSASFNEYEETQTSLVGISTKFTTDAFVLKPKLYWKRNQDMFLLRREDPSFSRNFNISNKIGAEVNASYTSKIGITGFGIDIASITLSSNNLGDQNRTMFNAFLEQRFMFANKKLDVTPGVSLNYFSDFEFQVLPGFDVGYKINDKLKVYGNIGYSYRIPTYTELYINIPNFLSGNEDLEPEKAFTEEMGIKYQTNKFSFSTVAFFRVATDLIDYVKETENSPFFLAQNLRKITTQGFEVSTSYIFNINNFEQGLNLNYTFLEDDYDTIDVFASRYLINTSVKHHFIATLQTKFLKFLEQSIVYKYVERPVNSYNVVDAKVTANFNSFSVFALANNIFDTEYSEKDFVPMPGSNVVFGLSYKIH
jgi:iron complex outermembrane receptor protein